MDVAIQHHDSVCIVRVNGRIDTLTAKSFGEQLSTLIGNGAHRLVIDLANVAYISSAGFRTLLVAARAIESHDGKLALASVGGEIRRLFDIAALTEFFPMWSTVDEAGAQLARSSASGGSASGTSQGS